LTQVANKVSLSRCGFATSALDDMHSSSSRNSRHPSGSNSFQMSNSILNASASRPFLNMLNPMGRNYQGYAQASQSPVEEEDEAGSSGSPKVGTSQQIPRREKQKVSWDAVGQDNMMESTFHPNIQQEDRVDDRESDDEVPQSLMIEAPSRKAAAAMSMKGKGKARDRTSGRTQPLFSTSGRKVPPILPMHTSDVPLPPRPSETDVRSHENPRREPQARPMRGLDAYERALWNWVNVYNLDGFLQEVYWYYEGKGLYSIALARGLNLLSVIFP
jgi:autophagy-related protein 9